MKKPHTSLKAARRLSAGALAAALAFAPAALVNAEDIDLFVAAAIDAATNPNILIVIDNSANWASASQHWDATLKQGESELRALTTVLKELDGTKPRVNLGLMMFTEGQGSDFNGAYVRYHVRTMDTMNRDALVELIGASTCTDSSNSLNTTPNCILKNFQGGEQVGTAKTDYSAALFEAYKYLGGWSSPAFAQKDAQPTGAINDNQHHGTMRYAGTVPNSRFDPAAYTAADKLQYKDWATNACTKNYIIFIGNGFPTASADVAGPKIANVNGGASPLLPAQLALQNFTTITTTSSTNLGTDSACKTQAKCASDAKATFGSLYDSYSCTGGTTNSTTQNLGTDVLCETQPNCVTTAQTTFPGLFSTYSCTGGVTIGGVCTGGGKLINQTMQGTGCIQNQTIQGTKTTFTVTPLQTFSTPTVSNARYADEWAQFLNRTDVSKLLGQQNATIYTVDVFKDQQDANQSALLFNMAKHGGGRYFQAQNENAIVAALRQIMIEVQSVNSVFASASLPINATNRSQNENQVFIGMFRPEGTGNPRWYGNLKRYQIAQFGQDFKLGDASSPPQEAVSLTTGFVQPCAVSFWTVDSGKYWLFQNGSSGQCSSVATDPFSDSPDGPLVEKGAVAEVIRRGNNPPTAPGELSGAVSRALFTCATSSSCCPSCSAPNPPATTLVPFDKVNVSKAQLGDPLMNDIIYNNILNFTRGEDVRNENNDLSFTDVRASIHGDVAHSRPLPVNYGPPTGVVLFYGANDGTFRAVRGSDGRELWAFIAPEHHSRLMRLEENFPQILYPSNLFSVFVSNETLFKAGDIIVGTTSFARAKVSRVGFPGELVVTEISDLFVVGEQLTVGGKVVDKVTGLQDKPPVARKDYFFDGSAGLFQNKDNTKIMVYPSMRRGGRMVYAFDITKAPNPVDTTTLPRMLWKVGCTNPSLTDTASCTVGFEQLGQTWSTPAVALVKGYSANVNTPVVIIGGGYDTCEDQDATPNSACNRTAQRGNRVYILDATSGKKLAEFATHGSVASDLTLVDRDFDGFADHAYAVTTSGRIYRIDFVDPANPSTVLACDPSVSCNWRITLVGFTDGADRKFLFAAGALAAKDKVYLAIASGNRERPLIINHPFPTPANPGVLNRAYMAIDKFTGTPLNLDDPAVMEDLSKGTACAATFADTPEGRGKSGWFINLNAASSDPAVNVGEQGVTSTTIFAGLIFFSTNRPVPTPPGACKNNLGEARGYALNLLNASGAADTLAICGGARSAVFVGGGLPPSPVTGTIPVGPAGNPVTIMIGGVQRGGGVSAPIGAQRVTPTITQRRGRVYWYTDGDK